MITIIDYSMGNLFSAAKACEYFGYKTQITALPEDIINAEKLILPGVGAFGEAMEKLRERELEAPIKEAVSRGVPLIGICLGMQLLFSESEEDSGISGLSLLGGDSERIVKFPSGMIQNGFPLKVPHMGWNSIRPSKNTRLLKDIPEDTFVYFVHSYCAPDVNAPYAAAMAEYGIPFVCAVEYENVYGTQFHPEKSGKGGMRILKNFLEL